MKGKTYIISSGLFEGEVIYEYNLKGWLIAFKLNASQINMVQLKWLYNTLPYNLGVMRDWLKNAKNFKVTELPTDLSFERFWNEYNHKVGKKVQTENAWKRMSVADKVNALLFIPLLQKQKKKEGTDMPYPSTYLAQRYFDI